MDEHRGEATRRWRRGDEVVLRYLTRSPQGTPGVSWPCRVVEDRDDLLALFIAEGTIFKEWRASETGQRELADTRWRRDVLRLMFPGRSHSVWLFWETDANRSFRGYYVNFEEPFRRTSAGFDTNDHTLDLLVTPALAWSWKDREDFDARVAQRVYSSGLATAVYADAHAMITVIEAGGAPFGDGWEAWSPDPAWRPAVLPADWADAPVALWDRREWAYVTT